MTRNTGFLQDQSRTDADAIARLQQVWYLTNILPSDLSHPVRYFVRSGILITYLIVVTISMTQRLLTHCFLLPAYMNLQQH